MSVDAGTFEVRGLCKIIGLLGGLHDWNESTPFAIKVFIIQVPEEDQVRIAELVGHTEFLHTERKVGEVDSYKLAEACVTEQTPLQLLHVLVQVLHERVGVNGDEGLRPSRYAKHIDERDAQLAKQDSSRSRDIRLLK